MKYDFDKVIERRNTGCLKWDCHVKRGHKPDELPLWVADMDFQTVPEAIDALVTRSQHGIFGYTLAQEPYYEAVLGWFERHHGWRPNREWIVLTPGVVFALATAIRAFTHPGDAVVIQPPVYYPFRLMIEENGRTVAPSPLIYDADEARYRMDFEGFERTVRETGAKLFILCNPHNPCGRAWTEEELRRIGDICLANGVTVIADEIHADFARPGVKHVPFASLGEQYADIAVVCTAPSKTFNLAGLQASNIFIANRARRAAFKRSRSRTGYDEPSVMGIVATQACYEHGDEWLRQLKEYLEGNLGVLRDACESTPGIRLVEPESTYLPWVDVRDLGLSDEGVRAMVEDEAKLWLDLGPMFGKEGSGFVRMSIASPRSMVQEACDRLAGAAAKHAPGA